LLDFYSPCQGSRKLQDPFQHATSQSIRHTMLTPGLVSLARKFLSGSEPKKRNGSKFNVLAYWLLSASHINRRNAVHVAIPSQLSSVSVVDHNWHLGPKAAGKAKVTATGFPLAEVMGLVISHFGYVSQSYSRFSHMVHIMPIQDIASKPVIWSSAGSHMRLMLIW